MPPDIAQVVFSTVETLVVVLDFVLIFILFYIQVHFAIYFSNKLPSWGYFFLQRIRNNTFLKIPFFLDLNDVSTQSLPEAAPS